MKRLVTLILLAALLLAGCSSGGYEADGVCLTVDWEQCQIGDGQNVYNFTWERSGDDEKVFITYPNDTQYCVHAANGTVMGLSANHPGDISEYISPETLYAAINDQRPATALEFQGFDGYDIIMFIIAGILIVFGIYLVAAPDGAWHILDGWRVENGTPSRKALAVMIFRGACIIAAGIFLIASVIMGAFR